MPTNTKIAFATFTIITLSVTPLGAMATMEPDNSVKITLAEAPQPIPVPTESITVQHAQQPLPKCTCCGKVLRKIVRSCDQCIQGQAACCTRCSDRQANRMEQKMAARGNYLPELCCLTSINLAGYCYEGGLALCNTCFTLLAAYWNSIDLGTEITNEMQEAKEAQELKLAMLQEKIAILRMQKNPELIAQNEADQQEQRKAIEDSEAYYQSKLTALIGSKKDQ